VGRRRTLHGFLVIAGIALLPIIAHAESQFATEESSPLVASAHLDFTIRVPSFVFLQVGTGNATTSNLTTSSLVLSTPVDHIGDGTPVASGGGQVLARVIGNNGAIAFSSATSGAMNDGSETYLVSIP